MGARSAPSWPGVSRPGGAAGAAGRANPDRDGERTRLSIGRRSRPHGWGSRYLHRRVNARAFTTGDDVFFRQGEYEPQTSGAQRARPTSGAHRPAALDELERADDGNPSGDAFEQPAEAVAGGGRGDVAPGSRGSEQQSPAGVPDHRLRRVDGGAGSPAGAQKSAGLLEAGRRDLQHRRRQCGQGDAQAGRRGELEFTTLISSKDFDLVAGEFKPEYQAENAEAKQALEFDIGFMGEETRTGVDFMDRYKKTHAQFARLQGMAQEYEFVSGVNAPRPKAAPNGRGRQRQRPSEVRHRQRGTPCREAGHHHRAGNRPQHRARWIGQGRRHQGLRGCPHGLP